MNGRQEWNGAEVESGEQQGGERDRLGITSGKKEGTMDNAAAQPTAMILLLSLPPFALRHFIVQSCPVVDSS